MLFGAMRLSTSECESLPGQTAGCCEKESLNEQSALQGGDGGEASCADREDLTETEFSGLRGPVKVLEAKGLGGPRGNGDNPGRGGSLRSSEKPEAAVPLEKEFRLLRRRQSDWIWHERSTHGREHRLGNSYARTLIFLA